MKVKKFAKQFLAVFSCAAMLAGSASMAAETSASAAVIDTSKTGAIHITKYDMTAAEKAGIAEQRNTTGTQNPSAENSLAAYALQGVEFTYVKAAEIQQETKSEGADMVTAEVTYTIPEALEQALGMTGKSSHTYTSTELNTALADAVSSVERKNALEAYVKANGGTAMGKTDGAGKTSVSGLPLGLYLVVETSVPAGVNATTDPFFVSLPMTNADGNAWQYEVWVYPKNQTDKPTMSKKVKLVGSQDTYGDTVSADIGEKVSYRIVSKLPAITSTATYLKEYTYTDTMEAGLSYDQDAGVTIKFYTDEALSTPASIAGLEKDVDYTIVQDSAANKITIKMTDAGLEKINPGLAQTYMTVEYQAEVGSEAVLGDNGNQNQVVLSYGRSNTAGDGSGDGTEDPGNGDKGYVTDAAKVYTYGINLKKNFSGQDADATKVKFTLKNTADNKKICAAGSDGVYTVCAETQTSHTEQFSPASDGTLKIKGLKAGTYELTEVETDTGYMLLKAPLTITVTASSASITSADGITLNGLEPSITPGDAASAKVNEKDASMSKDGESDHAYVDLAVTNAKGFELPKTGGLGTILFTLAGAVGLALCIIFVTRKRRTES